MKLNYTILKIENLNLNQRQAQKVRGYFANKYSDNVIMHNHDDNKFIYSYPKVQYKVIGNKTIICGILEGADIVASIGIKEDKINIDGKSMDIYQKNIVKEEVEFGVTKDYIEYEFATPWLSLNQNNFTKYKNMNEMEREEFLKKILIGNILSISKSLGYTVDKQVYVWINLKEVDIKLKNIKMKGFKGSFKVNFDIPDYWGLGKSVSKGYGSIKRAVHQNKDLRKLLKA
ncbi:MAG: CRISPR-associated endonuclease Cas6 [Tepidibacter sp.]|jgi:hypothetical protein|uniref:CRISPR-associated endonuclease Cas6 n=1 Tax=Tepidibacter sp. TaxID=2529387 RepID=UPI0025CBC7C3|nr:CRISPR-associated endonuclease Cas6 [Tepidibacter sp.]MCT4507860.1 CRISPR-associated endonuclease Cas6 [Tepidibacter sp.]